MNDPVTISMREIAKRIEMKKIEFGKEREWIIDVLGHTETIFTTLNSLLEKKIHLEKRGKFIEKHEILSIPIVDFGLNANSVGNIDKLILELFVTYSNFSIHELQKLANYYEIKTEKRELPLDAVTELEPLKSDDMDKLNDLKNIIKERIQKAI